MFGGKPKEEQSTSSGLHNALASSTTIKGNIVTDTDFRLDGNVEGDIHCHGKIVVGAKGIVQGNIFCSQAEVHGKIIGTIQVESKLVLKASAEIQGDVITQSIEIEPNALFNGTCRMNALPEKDE